MRARPPAPFGHPFEPSAGHPRRYRSPCLAASFGRAAESRAFDESSPGRPDRPFPSGGPGTTVRRSTCGFTDDVRPVTACERHPASSGVRGTRPINEIVAIVTASAYGRSPSQVRIVGDFLRVLSSHRRAVRAGCRAADRVEGGEPVESHTRIATVAREAVGPEVRGGRPGVTLFVHPDPHAAIPALEGPADRVAVRAEDGRPGSVRLLPSLARAPRTGRSGSIPALTTLMAVRLQWPSFGLVEGGASPAHRRRRHA